MPPPPATRHPSPRPPSESQTAIRVGTPTRDASTHSHGELDAGSEGAAGPSSRVTLTRHRFTMEVTEEAAVKVTALRVWALWAVPTVLVVVTYSRLPAQRLYRVSGSGLAAGLGRGLVYVAFPVSLVAIAVVGATYGAMAHRWQRSVARGDSACALACAAQHSVRGPSAGVARLPGAAAVLRSREPGAHQ